MSFSRVVLTLAAAALVYAAAAGPLVQNRTPVVAAAERAAPSASAAGFEAADLDGGAWRLADERRRGRVVLLNFWATWCPPCRAETPDLVRVADRYRDAGLSVVGVSMDEGDAEGIRRFVREYGIPYRIVRPAASSGVPFAVEALPTTYLLDRQGRVAKTYVGAVSEATLKGHVEALLAEDE